MYATDKGLIGDRDEMVRFDRTLQRLEQPVGPLDQVDGTLGDDGSVGRGAGTPESHRQNPEAPPNLADLKALVKLLLWKEK